MKKTGKSIFVICAGIAVWVGAILVIGFSGAASVGKKAVLVDLNQLFNNYQKTIEYNQQLEKANAKGQEERKKFLEGIKRMQDELGSLPNRSRSKKQKEIDEKIKEMQKYDEATRQELTGQRNKYSNEISFELKEKIKAYGQKKDYYYILGGSSVLYKKDNKDNIDITDITNELIAELNKAYQKKQKTNSNIFDNTLKKQSPQEKE